VSRAIASLSLLSVGTEHRSDQAICRLRKAVH
jgi:hypothetical protein